MLSKARNNSYDFVFIVVEGHYGQLVAEQRQGLLFSKNADHDQLGSDKSVRAQVVFWPDIEFRKWKSICCSSNCMQHEVSKLAYLSAVW